MARADRTKCQIPRNRVSGLGAIMAPRQNVAGPGYAPSGLNKRRIGWPVTWAIMS
jgi:hypothetical protein